MTGTTSSHMAVVERGPGLRPYRARKPPTVHRVDHYDDRLLILVVRTHDQDGWHEAAVNEHARHVGREHLYSHTAWTRHVPWGDDGGTWLDCEPTDRNAVPCVWYEPEVRR